MRVAAIQFRPVHDDVVGNLRRLAVLVTRAAQSGAKLIVLPELALTGYSIMSREEALGLSEPVGNFNPEITNLSSMSVFHALARRYDTHIAWGLIERSSTGALHNAQVLMTPSGAFESYAKVCRFGNDYLWSDPGRSNPPVRTLSVDGQNIKVGLLICRDVRDKADSEWNSFYERGDADIVALSTSWGRSAFPATAWMDFARKKDVTLVVANRYGLDAPPNDFGDGGICVIFADQRVVHEGLKWGEDCIVYADV